MNVTKYSEEDGVENSSAQINPFYLPFLTDKISKGVHESLQVDGLQD